MIDLTRDTFLEKRNRQVFSQNSKMKKSKIKETDFVINWLLPEYKSKLYDLITCPTALNCIGDCYVSQGYGYRMPNTRAKMEMNLGLSLSEYFIEDIYKSLKKYKKATHVRIHDSGDFYSKEYLAKWLKIIRDNPELTFYAYTKRISMFKAIKDYIPENFIVIFSFGGIGNLHPAFQMEFSSYFLAYSAEEFSIQEDRAAFGVFLLYLYISYLAIHRD